MVEKKYIIYHIPDASNGVRILADDEGTWVTINGTHILIKDGETTAEAFKRTTGTELKPESPLTQEAFKTKYGYSAKEKNNISISDYKDAKDSQERNVAKRKYGSLTHQTIIDIYETNHPSEFPARSNYPMKKIEE